MKYEFRQNLNLFLESPLELAIIPKVVHLVGSLDEGTGLEFRELLRLSVAEAELIGQDIIPIFIDTYGGDAYSALGCIDAMRSIQEKGIKLATIIESKAMSAGAIIAGFGTPGYRYCAPSATIMIHEVSCEGGGGTCQEVQINAKEVKRLNKLLYNDLSRHCGKKKNSFFLDKIKKTGGDLFISPQEAEKIGLIDKVGLPTMKVEVQAKFSFGV